MSTSERTTGGSSGPKASGAASTTLSMPKANDQPLFKRDIPSVVKSLKQHVRNGSMCKEHLLVLHSRLFEDARGAKETFAKFVLNSTGGVATLLATIENHLGDPTYLEVALVFLCNLMHFGGKRNLRVVAKVAKKGGSRICLSLITKHANTMRVVHPATMAVIALASVDGKILVTARLSGCLTTLLTLMKQYQTLPREGISSVVSCLSSLARGEANLVLLGKKGAVALLLEMCTRNIAKADSPLLRWVCKAIFQLCGIDDNAKEVARDGGVALMLNVMYEQPSSIDIQRTCLDILKIIIRFPEGSSQFQAAGGFAYVVSLIVENNADKQGDDLIDLVVQLFRFFNISDLPIGADNDLHWAPPTEDEEQKERDSGADASSNADSGADEGTDGRPDANPEMARLLEGMFSPELHEGDIPAETAIPDAVVVRHVKPFSDPRPSPSCPSSMEFVPPVEELLVQTQSQRSDIIRHEFKRLTCPEQVINQVVYDDLPRNTTLPSTHLTTQVANAGPYEPQIPALRFGSNFESGNLKRAIRVFDNEYDLILHNDINTQTYCQWFYFSVENMRSDVTYKFNIINMEKPTSTFSTGQRPLIFSEKRFTWSGFGWLRTGHNISYMRNSYRRRLTKKKRKETCYYTLTFCVRFPHEADRAYLANAYPYTFSDLIGYIKRLGDNRPYLKDCLMAQSLCTTQSGNVLPLLTITALTQKDGNPYSAEDIRKRYVCIVSARVHPGETIASYVCKGLIEYLLDSSETAEYLREHFVWKIVPMLNPDGVVNGNHRCALSGKDLNREFVNTTPRKVPTIHFLKEITRYIKCTERRDVMIYGDFHGHSRRNNFFIYACGSAKREVHGLMVEKVFPKVLGELTPYFSASGCTYKVQRSKATTGRVVFYRELGIRMSFTLEGSMMGGDGCDFLPLSWGEVEEDIARRAALVRQTQGHFNTAHYCTMGAMFGKAVMYLVQGCEEGTGKAYEAVIEMLQDIQLAKQQSKKKGKQSAEVVASPATAAPPAERDTTPVDVSRGGATAGASSTTVVDDEGNTEVKTPTSSLMSGTYASNRRSSQVKQQPPSFATASSAPSTGKQPSNKAVARPAISHSDVVDVLSALLKGLPMSGMPKGRRRQSGTNFDDDNDDDGEDDDDAEDDEVDQLDDSASSEDDEGVVVNEDDDEGDG